jgi:putative oxidoreductase
MNQILNHPFWGTHALLIGRIGMGALFLVAGINKLNGGIEGLAGMIGSAGFPFAIAIAWLVAIFEVVTGAAIILGKYFKEATLTLAVFVFIITFIFHSPLDWAANSMPFLKNMAIMGGLLFMGAYGVGNTWRL